MSKYGAVVYRKTNTPGAQYFLMESERSEMKAMVQVSCDILSAPLSVLAFVGAVGEDSLDFLPFKEKRSSLVFGGGDDSMYDPNVVDIVRDLHEDDGCSQNDMLFRYCASAHSYATVVPHDGYCQSCWGSDHDVEDRGGNACIDSPSRVETHLSYEVIRSASDGFFQVDLQHVHPVDSSFGEDINRLTVQGTAISEEVCRLEITDAAHNRWRTPHVYEPPLDDEHIALASSACSFDHSEDPFGVSVAFDGFVMFNSTPTSSGTSFRDLIFKDKYIEWSSQLPLGYKAYGLGERVAELSLSTEGITYSFTALDHFTPYRENLYGVHPMMLVMLPSGHCFGIFLNNNHGMDITLFPDHITYQVMGGIVDLFFFSGSSPMDVVRQYQSIVGKPAMPPYWSLGFHQCRWGYKNIGELQEVIDSYNRYDLPLDTLWSDIDYMDNKKLFTLDPINFPERDMKSLLSDLHEDNRRYVIIVDPGVRIEDGYSAYEEAVKQNVFVKDEYGNAVVGKVWPGLVSFIDWASPNASSYWIEQVKEFHSHLPFDGLWIDMNEVASFCDGHCILDTEEPADVAHLFSCPCSRSIYAEDPSLDSSYDFPPFWASGRSPAVSTISMSALHHSQEREYDWHSLYGHAESIATQAALQRTIEERTLVITRSSFSSTGHHVGHWLGDNHATWYDLKMSIPGILTMNILGIPLVGADICGFAGNTTEELCTRWMELGAFYPFSRNHNDNLGKPQEPYALGDTVLEASRSALEKRYRILPYLYSRFYDSHLNGGAVALPLFFLDPSDITLHTVDDQFLLGDAIMVAPIVTEGALNRLVVFPSGAWFHLFSGLKVEDTLPKKSSMHSMAVPLTEILVFQRAGTIVSLQESARNTVEGRATPFTLQVALAAHDGAFGDLYIDDGVHINTSHFTHIVFEAEYESRRRSGYVTSGILKDGYHSDSVCSTIRLLGIHYPRSFVSVNVYLNDELLDDEHVIVDRDTQQLTVQSLSIDLHEEFTLNWLIDAEMKHSHMDLEDEKKVWMAVLFVLAPICILILVFVSVFRKKILSRYHSLRQSEDGMATSMELDEIDHAVDDVDDVDVDVDDDGFLRA